MKAFKTILISTVSIYWMVMPAKSQGILEQLESTLTCTLSTQHGSANVQVGKNKDGSLNLNQDGMRFSRMVEGDGEGQYEKSDDGSTYAILMDPELSLYYIVNFEEETLKFYGLGGKVNITGICD